MLETLAVRGKCVSYAGFSYELRPGETLLEGLLRGGANLPFSCRRGTCQVCMMQVERGDPGPEASADLREEQRAAGLILPCRARPRSDLELVLPDPTKALTNLHVIERAHLADDIVRLRLLADSELPWRAGQFLTLAHPSGALRSYSIASVYELGEPIELHVRRCPGGLVSTWLCDELEVGEVVQMRGPSGACFYEFDRALAQRELLLVAGGTGLAPLWAIAREALRCGHAGPITLIHGSRMLAGVYLHEPLRELAEAHENFNYQAWVDEVEGPLPPGIEVGPAVDAAFPRAGDEVHERAGVLAYFAGPPAMVHEARYRAVLAGVSRADVHADPFDGSEPYMPEDGAKIAAIEPDPELWEALRRGPGLSEILADFYEQVFEDSRLAPFFQGITKQRVREKQYEFLSDLFTGSGHFFGARPFNAHHWMVISDELFDYREAMFEAALRRHGLAERLIRRWLGTQERFRREIVKSQRRGLVFDGVEHLEEGHRDELLDIACLCDGCGGEIEVGERARHQLLTGKLYCAACSGVEELGAAVEGG